MKSISKKKFTKLILSWYKENRRDLPWRNIDDTYRVLVSELLLQKTNAQKVEDIFDEFFSKYPTIYEINNEDINNLETILKPLGIFRKRADRLKKISLVIIDKFSGKIPGNKNDLLKLYGVGEYIVNAVLCFGYKKSVPIVDTNVIRIFERLFQKKSIKNRARTDKEIWKFADKMLPEKNVQDYNYALLDFASIVCKARNPECKNCIFLFQCAFGKNFIII